MNVSYHKGTHPETTLLILLQGKEISLDLCGFRNSTDAILSFLTLIKSSFDKSGSELTLEEQAELSLSIPNLEFEGTLRYVDIPVPEMPASNDSDPQGGRAEVSKILEWLRSNKVTGIFELRVRDSPYRHHSEGAIFSCLRDFDVESLDWMRVDLSCIRLKKACPNLKELTLYVGSFTFWDHWTSKAGYDSMKKTFPKLQSVTIYFLKDLIQPDLFGLDLDLDFGEMQKYLPKWLEIEPSSWSALRRREETLQTDTTITAIRATQLAGFLKAYKATQREFAKSEWRDEKNLKAEQMPNIKIAVIDTGAEKGSLSCHRINGASFVSSDSGESPWWVDQERHGTQTAKIITELDPCCHLLVAKFSDLATDLKASRVAKAITWAIEADADIISISGAFFTAETVLEDAISDAIKAGVVVVASTAGEGHRKGRVVYPANYEAVLRIAASDWYGKETAESVLDNAHYKTSFLGSEVVSEEVSGASVATAIAAGIASLILSCHRIALSTQGDKMEWKYHKGHKRAIVESYLTKMAGDSTFVKPWLVFKEGPWGGIDDVMGWIKTEFLKK